MSAATAIALLAAAPATYAQDTRSINERRPVSIAAGALDETLIAIGDLYGVDILVSGDLVDGVQVGAVSGELSATEVLRRALSDAGLRATRKENGAFVISEGPSALRQNAVGAEGRAGVQDEIVVMGTKQGLTVQESEVSAEVFSAERIDRESVFSLDDLVLRTSNVTLGGNSDTITIRGIARSGIGDAGQGVTSNVYLDGAPISNEALFFGFDSLWDVAQVEVLRGPQSTVQGRNALAGAIVITTKDPTYEWEAAARLRYETFNSQQYAGIVSGPIIEDQLAIRLAVDHQKTDGFVDNAVTGNDQDFSENLLLRGKLLIEPAPLPDLRAEVTVDFNDSRRGAPRSSIFFPIAADDPAFEDFDVSERLTFGEPIDADSETLRVISDISYDLNENLTLRAIGTYEGSETAQLRGDFNDLTQFPLAGDSMGETDTYSGELRAEFDYGRFSGIVGAYYFEDDFESVSTIAVPLATQIFFPIDPADSVVTALFETGTATTNYAFYAQTRFDLTPAWTLDFGIRYDNEEYSTPGAISATPTVTPDGCEATIPGSLVGSPSPTVALPCSTLIALFVPASDGTPQTAEFDAFLPRGAVTYNASEGLSFFASVQRGYRAGGTYLRQTSAGVEVGTFDPEFLTNVEIGFRSQWFDRRLTLNGNIFHSWLADQQVVVPGPSGLFLDAETVNAGESTLKGVEVSANYQMDSGLNVYGNLGLLDAKFEDFPFAAPEGSPFDNLEGNSFPQAAPVSFNLGASYEHISGVFADANLNYIGSNDSAIANLDEDDLGPGLTEVVDARATVNLRLGYKHDTFRITGYVTNLLDDDTQTRRSFGRVNTTGGAVQVDPNAGVDLQQPRVFGVQLDIEI